MKFFRFRGREDRLLVLFRAFREHQGTRTLHPAELARITGLSLVEATMLMDDTPELFIRLLGKGRRYRLATSIAARSDAEIEALIRRRARAEQFTLLSVTLIVVLAAAVLVMPLLPWMPMPKMDSP